MSENFQDVAQIIFDGQTHTVPVLTDAFGNRAPDITGLFKKTGVMMVDRGFTSTAGCESKITYIDGKKGLLLYRGYPIEQLAEKSNYVEIVYLLLKGELPTNDQLTTFQKDLRLDQEKDLRSLISEQMIEIIKRYRRDTPPMLLIGSAVAALDAFYGDSITSTPEGREEIALNLIAKIPTIVALAHRFKRDRPIIYPRPDLGYAENFLRMCFAQTDAETYSLNEPYYLNKAVVKAMDMILMLHADHEQNASTSTVRLAGSTGVAPHAAVATGIAALWGPSHGGANAAVLRMLERIGTKEKIPAFIKRCKKTKKRVMGFGHRIYQVKDPRATLIAKACHEVLKTLNIHDPLLDLAIALEEAMLNDKKIVEKNLYPNVDFYSGIIMKAIGFPLNMFTPIFALSRTTGWTAQWKEMVEDGPLVLGRPRQHYTGYTIRDYPDIDTRGASRNDTTPTRGIIIPHAP